MTETAAVEAFAYDVFVSYRQAHPDGTWVRNVLVPRLKGSGFQVFVDYDCFRLGEKIISEMLRGVEESRYTLAVMSPAYIESQWTEFESDMAEHLGLERAERRLLVVMRELCKPRLSIRARLWLDMTDDGKFEAAFAKLGEALRRA